MSRVFTIGHSNHDWPRFLALLHASGIEVVADVRSVPSSAYSPQFEGRLLAASLAAVGMRYVFLGAELGGRPPDPQMYDSEGHVLYGLLSESHAFRLGIERLLGGTEQFRVALMCGEEDPTSCHRRRLIGRVLGALGVEVVHIRGDGRHQSEAEVEAEERIRYPERFQLRLLADRAEWRSVNPLMHRRPPVVS